MLIWSTVAFALDWTPAPDLRLAFPSSYPIDSVTARAVAAGDFDGDGDDDIAVSVNDVSDLDAIGRIHVYPGDPAGLGTLPAVTLISPFEPDPVTEPDMINTRFGDGLLTADVNGDGVDDLVVGLPLWPGHYGTERNPGALAVYFGGPAGLDPTGGVLVPGPPTDGGPIGFLLFGTGDTNGDGHDDLVTVRQTYESTRLVQSWHGGLGGLTLGAFEIDVDTYYDWSVAGAGDVDSDGFSDLITCRSVDEGQVKLFPGSASGIDLVPVEEWSGSAGQGLGTAAAVGDVTGDGLPDLLLASGDQELLVYPSTGTAFASTASEVLAIPYRVPELRPLADHDGNGSADLVLTAQEATYFVPGGTKGLAKPPWPDAWVFSPTGETRNLSFPIGGDFDADGAADFAVLGRAETYHSFYYSSIWEFDAAVGVWYGALPAPTTGGTTPPGTTPPDTGTTGPTTTPPTTDPDDPPGATPDPESPDAECGCTKTGPAHGVLPLVLAVLRRRRRGAIERTGP